MSVVTAPVRTVPPVHQVTVGPIGRVGAWAAAQLRAVLIAWAVVAVALAVFAPRVETALSGAGWQANGSDSVRARTLIERNFAGLSSSAPMVVLHSQRLTVTSPQFRAAVARVGAILHSDRRIARVVPPQPGASISRDGHTAIVTAGVRGDPTAMVAAADALKSKLRSVGTADVSVSLTGASGMWSDSTPRTAPR